MIIAITIGILVAGGVFLVLQRGMVRLILGMSLIGHASNLALLAVGIGKWRAEPIMYSTNPTDAADPLPQAFVLTAIVISMATAAFMLTLAALGNNDDTMVDPLKQSPDTVGSPVYGALEQREDGSEGIEGSEENSSTKDFRLPDLQRKEVIAMQTMGRKAHRISTESGQWQRRQKREKGLH